MDTNDLLYAGTHDGVAFCENGLRNVEKAFLAKRDWNSPEEREQALARFYESAARLRTLDAQVTSKANQKL